MIEFVETYLPELISVLPATISLWLLAIFLGIVLGLVLACIRCYGSILPARVVASYVDVIRGTPMLVQMFVLYFGLPELGFVLTPFAAAVLAIGLNSAAYQSEYIRAGILAVPANQFEAARAIGLGRSRSIKDVVLPQALRLALPAMSNEIIVELQYTSVAYTIGVVELTGRAEKIGYETYRFFDAFLLCGVVYMVLTFLIIVMMSSAKLKAPSQPQLPAGRR